MNAVSILPEEMWRVILGKLTTTKDTLSAHNTCRLWRSLLKENQTQWMFQDVFPSLFKHLSKADILKCRLVCKSWNTVTESYLENDQKAMVSPGRHYMYTKRAPFRTFEIDFEQSSERLGITQTQAMERFQKQFTTGDDGAPSSKNPFVSRSLDLIIEKGDLAAIEFFSKFGTHLWSLQLFILETEQSEHITPVELVEFIWCILHYVPNLRKLVLATHQTVSMVRPNALKNWQQIMETEEFLKNNLAPWLPHLNNLQLEINHDLLREALETSYCPQLTKYVHTTQRKSVPWNLEKLTDAAWVFTDGFTLSQLDKFKNLDSPCLQRLHIYVIKFGMLKDNCSRPNLLFEALESFKSSLTHLSLFWRHFEGTFPATLNLPLVEELSLEIRKCENPKNVNFFFLKTLKSLRKLTCVFWQDCYSELFDFHENAEKDCSLGGNIDLHQHLDEDLLGGPYNSNIWRLLPSLDMIEIKVVSEDLNPPSITDSIVYSRVYMENNVAF